MDLILTNGRIASPGTNPGLIEEGFIAIQDGVIVAVGAALPEGLSAGQVVDLAGKLVLPGMINAHTHLYSALALGMPWPAAPPQNFVEKLQKIWWRLDRALDTESTRASFAAGLLDCLHSGVTTVIDHHSSQNFIGGSLELLAEVAETIGINVAAAFEITDRNGPAGFQAGLQENLDFFNNYRNHPNIRPLIGLHASFTLLDESLATIRRTLGDDCDWGVHIHVSEDQADETDARNRGYRSVIDRLQAFDLINQCSLIIHGLHMPPEDVDILAQTGALLVHNPTSNANNRVGILSAATVNRLKAGLGTDGMQANLLNEAKEGTLIRSHSLTGGADNLDYSQLLFDHNPAIASRIFGRSIGKIQVGASADLAIYDYSPRTELSAANLSGHLLFGLDRPEAVIINGKFKLRDRQCVTLDEDELLHKARFQSRKLWAAMEQLTVR
ncbi:MAG: amidohydrolase family protein [Candidatus Neomarinimicrobiota bacterium]